ncbi:MAG: type II secretion system protein GspH [Lysobacterales bacterium RIFOXYD1_FULL_69_11]|nr:MAG: type II secretion system protein GspH [Xanthomonadales bacterium RIFOXYD1_FULL_69_11]
MCGFTLVELMVVLFIVGLMGAAVMLTAPGEGDVLARDADTLATQLVRAQEEAILGTRAIQVVVDAAGHRVERQDFDRWDALDDAPFRSVEWTPGTTPAFEGAADRVTFRFDESGGARVASVALQRDGRRVRIGVGDDARIHVGGEAGAH